MTAITLLTQMKQFNVGNTGVLNLIYAQISEVPALKTESDLLLSAISEQNIEKLQVVASAFTQKHDLQKATDYAIRFDYSLYNAAIFYAASDANNCKIWLQNTRICNNALVAEKQRTIQSTAKQNPLLEGLKGIGVGGYIGVPFAVVGGLMFASFGAVTALLPSQFSAVLLVPFLTQ